MPTTNLYNAYNTSTAYQTNDIVLYGNSIYVANYPNQGVPTTNSDVWTLLIANFDGIVFKGVWNSITSYTKGQYVTYNNVAYISVADNNTNHTPNVAPTYWKPVTVSAITSQPGDITYQGTYTNSVLNIGANNQVLKVVSGFPAWANVLQPGIVNQILSFAANGTGQWTNQYPSGSATQFLQLKQDGTVQWANTLPTGAVNQVLYLAANGTGQWGNTLPSGAVNQVLAFAANGTGQWTSDITVNKVTTASDVTIGGNLLVQGTTTTVNTDVFQTTEYANVIIANTTTSNVLSSNTFTTVNLTSNNITSNTVNTKGIVVNSAYVGPFLGGAIVDYSTGNARVSVAGTDGINFYNGGQGSTLLATLSNGGVFTTSTVNTNSLTVNKLSSIHSIFESANVQASAAGSTMNIYLNSGSVFYYTANSTSNMTFNFVYDGVSTLNSTMPVGQAVSSAILVSQGATPYYPTTVQVDGVTITPKWLGASAPSTGDANTINSYSFSLIKTASATYTILASASKFA